VIKLAIIGSRSLGNSKEAYNFVYNTLLKYFKVSEIELIISGGAVGPDSLSEEIAKQLNIPTKIFEPDWKTYGKSAGFRRNSDIIQAASHVLAIHDKISKGTLNSIELARKLGKDTVIVYFEPKVDNLEL